MANAYYKKALDAYLRQTTGYSWTGQDIRVMAIDRGNYTPNLDTHVSLSDIPAAARVASVAIGSRTTDGIGGAKGANVKFPTLTGPTIEALLIYRHTGTDSTSFLIAYIDAAPNLPFTPNGGDLDIVWSNDSILRFS